MARPTEWDFRRAYPPYGYKRNPYKQRPEITKEQYDKLVAEIKADIKAAGEIAKEFGLTARTVRKYKDMLERGIEPRKWFAQSSTATV